MVSKCEHFLWFDFVLLAPFSILSTQGRIDGADVAFAPAYKEKWGNEKK